ncbi:MAG TPA: type II toxin-antitoxin system VapC family toxin [Lacipirellulaceae bacterium]|nr:type II toxin-antitoxin system VapC family toxin [Lacipirellulaceae bacterium]HMP07661.1 type II toxin-antitoxin system VapC family toxin [Lacipirellulaceae bacterium]
MSVLIDTCVLIPLFNPDAQLHHESRIAVRRLRATQEELVVTAQNFAEFWNVSTRLIQHNGRGLAMPQVARMVDMIRRFSRLQLESETSLNIWLKLVQQLHVTGTSVHDARLVAIMLEGGIDRILTYNEGDFRRYEVLGIQALSPHSFSTG